MRSKSIALLATALACGLVAAVGISQFMDAKNQSPDDGDKQPIYVALADINVNEELNPQNVKLEEWPKKIVPQGALTRLEEVEGKRCRIKLYAGEPILSSKLLGANDAIGAARDIPPGYRLAHVHVDAVTGSTNLILPGDRVDVIVFRQPNADSHATAAKIVLQDVKVFAVDTHTESEFSSTKSDQSEPMTAKTYTLLVTPQQAVILHAATQVGGAVRLALRNPEDESRVSDEGINMADIFGPERRSDRDAEHKAGDKDQLTGAAEQHVAVAPPQAPLLPENAIHSTGPTRTMMVLLGAQLKQIEFPSEGGPPLNQPQGDAAGPMDLGPSQFTGEPGGGTPAPPEPDSELPPEEPEPQQ